MGNSNSGWNNSSDWNNSSAGGNGGWGGASGSSGGWGNPGTGGNSSWGTNGASGNSSWGGSGSAGGSTGGWGNTGNTGGNGGWGSGSGDGFVAPKKEGKVTFDTAAMFVTLLCAAVGMVLGMMVYGTTLPAVLRIGLLVLLAAGLPLAGLAAYCFSHRERHGRGKLGLQALAAALVLLFGTGCLMQFLYSLGSETRRLDIDDYVFVIDYSGSMATTDPNRDSISSLRGALAQMDEGMNAALVCFTDTVDATVPMAPATQAHLQSIYDTATRLQLGGGTSISGALQYVLDGPWLDPNRNAMIVLLTDGEELFIPYRRIAANCSEKNTIITTIGLGGGVNEGSLRRLAETTGGMYYPADDPSYLNDIFTKIKVVSQARDLLGFRGGMAHGSMGLVVLRVFSWLLFGVLLGVGARLLRDDAPRSALLLICPAVAGLVIGVVLEAMNAVWVRAVGLRALLLVLFGLLPLFYIKVKREESTSKFNFVPDEGGVEVSVEDDDLKKKRGDNGSSIFK